MTKHDYKTSQSTKRLRTKYAARHAIKHGFALPLDWQWQQMMALARTLLECPEIKAKQRAEIYLLAGSKCLLENSPETYGQSIASQQAKYRTVYGMGAQDPLEDLSAHNSPEFAMIKHIVASGESDNAERTKAAVED